MLGGPLPPELGSPYSSLPKKFGRYEVVRELGKGAMGIVFLGRDPVIGRLVALKTIRAVSEDDLEQKEFHERFLREAQAAGILSHPNIVTIHDVGEVPETGVSFIAMEFVEGKNLKQILSEKQPMPYERVAEIIGQVAEALDYAHRRGIVHRDVKPANIIITPEGAVKITDFGIAKIEKSNLTSTGQFLGTPNYMSPEQVTGEAVDGRSDLFSLGVVLYELLTRKKPFSGDNLTSISYKIVHEAFTPPETYDANVPPEFGVILKKGLSKNPADRFQRGNDFALALYEYKAREEERAMLRDLSAMVAEAEKLGPVSELRTPPRTFDAPAPTPSGGAIPIPASVAAPTPAPPAPAAVPADAFVFPMPDEKTVRVDLAATPIAKPGPLTPGADGGTVMSPPRPTRPPRGAQLDASASLPGPEIPELQPPPQVPRTPEAQRNQEPKELQEIPGIREIPALELDVPPPPPKPTPAPRPVLTGEGPTIQMTREPARPKPVAADMQPTEVMKPLGPLPEAASDTASRRPASKPSVAPSRPTASTASAETARRPDPGPEERPTERLMDAAKLALSGAPPSPPVLPPPRPVEEPSAPAARTTPAQPTQLPPGATPSGAPGLKRALNPMWVLAIVGGLLLIAAVVIVLLVQKRRAENERKAIEVAEENAKQKETAERKALLDNAQKALDDGRYQDALDQFRQLVRRAPDSEPAKAGIAKAEQLLATKQASDQRQTELKQHLEAAQAAWDAGDDDKAISEADAVLALDPESTQARLLKNEAISRQAQARRASEDSKKKEADARKKARPTPTPKPLLGVVAPTRVETPPSPTPTPATSRLRITFQSPWPKGYVIVTVGSLFFREEFERSRNIDVTREVSAGPSTVKVILYPGSGKAQSGDFRLTIPGGDGHVLTVGVDGAQKPTVSLR